MKKFSSIINVILIIFAIGVSLFGGFIIAICCSCTSTAGGFGIDLSFLYSFFGLCFFIIGLLVLIKKTKKYEKYLHLGMFIYGILLFAACVFVKEFSEFSIGWAYNNDDIDVISPPNKISIVIAIAAVGGLIFYPFIKENEI